MDAFAGIAAQRRAFADVLDGLASEQWQVPSLCAEWTVRELAGHVVVPFELPMRRVILEMVRSRGSFDRANVSLARRAARLTPEELVASLRSNAGSRFTPPGHDWHAPLTDIYVHTFDACVPLGLEPPADPARWPLILGFLMSEKAHRGFLRRSLPELRFVATDLDWSCGDGDAVEGPAAALALTVLGRTALTDQLSGPGAPALAAWAAGS